MDIVSFLMRHNQVARNNKLLDVIMSDQDERDEVTKDLQLDNSYAITLTFTDDYLFKYNEHYLMVDVRKTLSKLKNVVTFVLVNDYSKAGRFHLHGTIVFKSLVSITHVRRVLSKYGITKVKPIDNIAKWAKYCTEQFSPDGKDGVKLDPILLRVVRR